MGSGENSDQIAVALQRDGDFGARIRLAGHVVRVASDVGSVVHFAGGCDVPDHSIAYLDAMALAVNGAAANPGQHEFRLFRIAEKDIDFDATQRRRHLVHDPRNEFFDVESGGDPLREFLQTHQFGEFFRGRLKEKADCRNQNLRADWWTRRNPPAGDCNSL